jgi:hypothetical protein
MCEALGLIPAPKKKRQKKKRASLLITIISVTFYKLKLEKESTCV